MNARKILACLAALLLAASLTGGAALAHKVNVFAVAERGVITGEGYFGGGGKAMNCPVEVLDARGALVASARTGADGSFSVPVPAGAEPPLRVVLKAGEGHQNDFTLTAADLGGKAPAPVQAAASPPAQAKPAPSVAQGIDEAALTSLVEAATAKAVEEKLAPLRLELAKLVAQESTGRLRDIVGGIGWIVGLVGIVAWFKRPAKK